MGWLIVQEILQGCVLPW